MATKAKKTKKALQKASVKAPVPSKKNVESVAIRPLSDRIVVRALTEDEAGTRSPSGIIIPDTISKEKPEQGIVVATGPGRFEDGTRVPLSVEKGDRVIFSKYGFDEVKVGGKEYFIVSEGSVLAVINE